MAVENDFKESTVTTSNHTVNYDLPLWEGDDVTSWLTQVNDAMNKIDSGIYDAKQSSHEVVTIAENAQKLAEETKEESDASAKIVEGYEGRLKTVEDTTAEHTTDLTNLSQRVDTQDTEIHSIKEVEQTILTDVGTLKTDLTKTTKLAQDATDTAADAMEEVALTVPKVEEAVEKANTASANAEQYGDRIGKIESALSANNIIGVRTATLNTYATTELSHITGTFNVAYSIIRCGNFATIAFTITQLQCTTSGHIYIPITKIVEEMKNELIGNNYAMLPSATCGIVLRNYAVNNEILFIDANIGDVAGTPLIDLTVHGYLESGTMTWGVLKDNARYIAHSPFNAYVEVLL